VNVLDYFLLLRRYGLNHPTSGNASDRGGITETGCNADGELVLVSWDSITKSQDAEIHRICYDLRSDINAILHAHPIYTVVMGQAPHVVDADWRTEKRKIAEALAETGFVLHLGHGVYAAAERAERAYTAICDVEHAAKTVYLRLVLP
jgi:ribulose-5-phosphate 4-epimerase/fuculose-1-phosphate aldolase